jgi:hypothetical protein
MIAETANLATAPNVVKRGYRGRNAAAGHIIKESDAGANLFAKH